MLKILFTFVTKQATLMRRSTVLSLPLQLEFPEQSFLSKVFQNNYFKTLFFLFFFFSVLKQFSYFHGFAEGKKGGKFKPFSKIRAKSAFLGSLTGW